ncbi:hypothetical protein CSA56_11770 [candidate division KSB3 bacterium]|uniref:Uncharacterized protein n=1 Tax=candidate division KSB3 bacterium TaxID=2044937 RepID=A0A2G6KFA5_9BACT|nr:MAG: hypothetical protein CSA56_11770 [candidate division KSB3 bacterium]
MLLLGIDLLGLAGLCRKLKK